MDINYYKQFEPIDGKWYLTKELGSGAYGTVFEVERKDFSQMKSAMKIISVPTSQNEVKNFKEDNFDLDDKSVTSYFYGFVEEFIKEFQVMARLKGHSNIVSYEDHDVIPKKGEFGWDIFIRMELLTPMNEHFKVNPPKQSDVIKIGIDICKALEVCQKYNIVHRDIKPSNIFISESGDYKLGDFGVARTLEKTSSGLSKKGTYIYMAPEVFKGEKYNSNVDIYSLGIVMYRLLNNNLEPFRKDRTYSDSENAMMLRMNGEQIPSPANAEGRLAEIVLKACSYDPKDRYESPIQMRTELESILYGQAESKYVYPNGDELEYEPSTNGKDKVEEGTVSLFSDDNATEEGTVSIFTDDNKKEEGTVSLFSDIEVIDIEQKRDVAPPEKEVYCVKCGHPYYESKTGRFCPNCGTDLSQASIFNPEENIPPTVYASPRSMGLKINPDLNETPKSIVQLYIDFWKKMFDFKGNISRKEYWLTILANAIISIPLMIVSKFVPVVYSIYSLYMLASWIAGTAINTRRLHDVGKSGHWQWLCLTGYGAIAVLVFLCQKTKNSNNKYKN